MEEEIKIETKEVKSQGNKAGYIHMKKCDVGKKFVVMTKKDLDYIMKK